jgi:hypothetical protein
MADYTLNVTLNGVEQSVQTIGQLEQALKATNDELTKVDTNSDAFTQLQQQAVTLDGEMNKLTQDAKQFNSQLTGVNATTNVLNDTIQSTATSAQQLGNSTNINKLTDGIQESNGSAKSLRTELRNITRELQGLEPGSARFQELSVRAGELRDTIGDTNAIVGSLAGNATERLGTALSGVANIGITGLQAITGGMQLFGVESEEARLVLEKLQGLLFLTQSIVGFGALPDAINNIKAGFSSLFVVKEADVLVTEAQALASTEAAAGISAEAAASGLASGALVTQTAVTEGATVATGALNIAMRALPIVAIVAGIATLAAGIYSYVSSSNAAKKAEEERKKKADELAKSQKEYADGVAKESSELVSLLFQLKATNAGTSERDKLLKKINSGYGATLKNLQDESKFQEQANLAIQDYINYQILKFKLQKNEEAFQAAISKRVDAENKLAKERTNINKNFMLSEDVRKGALGDMGAEAKFLNELGQKYKDFNIERTFEYQTYIKLKQGVTSLRDAYNSADASLVALTKRRNQIVKETTDITKDLFGNIDKEIKTTTTVTKLTKDQTAAAIYYNETLKERIRLADEEAQDRVKKTAKLTDDLEEEQRIVLRNLKERYDEAIKTDALEVKEKKKTKSEKSKIEATYNSELDYFDKLYKDRIKAQKDIELESDEEVKRQLLEANKILNDEIKFGDSDVSDQKTALNQRLIQLSIDELDRVIENNRLDYESYRNLIAEKLKLQGELAAEQLNINTRVAEANRIKDLDTFIQTQEQLLNSKIVSNKKLDKEDDDAFKKRIEKEGQYYIVRENGEKVVLEKFTENEKLAYENVIKQKENIDEAYATTVTELTTEYVNENANTQIESDEDVYQKRLDILDEFFTEASSLIDVFQGAQVSGLTSIVQASLTGIQDYFKLVDQDFANNTEKVAAYAAAIGGAISTILAGFAAQRQALLEQDLLNLKIESDARKDGLTTTYNEELTLLEQKSAAGLITEQQYTQALKAINDEYNSGIKSVNDKLTKDQRKEKEKAFEDDKKLKVAQAIISGLQGAVQAFAGAMSLGPIAGPIVGAILAAAVGGLAAANVAQIKKTKFDGGAAVTQNTPNTDSIGLNSAVTDSSLGTGGGFTTFSEGAMGSPGGFVPSTPFGSTSNNQRVYVVESDITAAQNRVRVLEENSTFG